MPTIPIFPFIPSYTTTLSKKPRLLEMQFGEGYAQIMPDGIQFNPLMYNIVFEKIRDTDDGQHKDAGTIQLWIDTNGVSGFYWAPPPPYQDTLHFFRCFESQYSYDEANTSTLVLPFKEYFDYPWVPIGGLGIETESGIPIETETGIPIITE